MLAVVAMCNKCLDAHEQVRLMVSCHFVCLSVCLSSSVCLSVCQQAADYIAIVLIFEFWYWNVFVLWIFSRNALVTATFKCYMIGYDMACTESDSQMTAHMQRLERKKK